MIKKTATLTPAFAALFFAFAFAPAPLALALEWNNTEIEHRAEVGESLPSYVFTCTNTGTATVTITEMHPGCGCLAPTLDKNTLAPGQSANLTVHFDRTGLARETARIITIVTDEPGRAREPYQLVLRADLPEALAITPRLCAWKKDEKPTTKFADIKINLPRPVEIKTATSNDDNITVKLVALEAGRHYRLDITPRGTAKPLLAIITLQPADPLPADTALTVYAQVR
jgi:hypothetical protein